MRDEGWPLRYDEGRNKCKMKNDKREKTNNKPQRHKVHREKTKVKDLFNETYNSLLGNPNDLYKF